MKFLPKDIVLSDDAQHKKGNFGRIETWYYDAVFDYNHSMAIVINVIYAGIFSVVLVGLCLYKNGRLLHEISDRFSYKYFHGSIEKPSIILKNQHVLKSFEGKKNNNWIFNIEMKDEKYGADLKFSKNSRAWQGKTFLGNWLVIPKFNVSGNILINGNLIEVNGHGYHDHNIYPIYASVFNKGYHFGKISKKSYILTWANITKSQKRQQKLAIFNSNKEYFSIEPDEIEYEIHQKSIDHKKEMPIKYSLKIDSKKLFLYINAESLNYHHTGIPSVNYWRYHVRNVGEIKIGSLIEKIDNIEISEYLKFL